MADLVTFVEALTDPCVEDSACLGAWVPDTSDTGPDNLQLNGFDEDGGGL